MMFPNPLIVYVTAGALVIGAVSGYKVRSWKCDAAYAKALEKAAEQQGHMQEIIDDKSQAYEQAAAEAQDHSARRTNTIRTIYKSVPLPPSNCVPPDDAVGMLLESINDTPNASTASESSE